MKYESDPNDPLKVFLDFVLRYVQRYWPELLPDDITVRVRSVGKKKRRKVDMKYLIPAERTAVPLPPPPEGPAQPTAPPPQPPPRTRAQRLGDMERDVLQAVALAGVEMTAVQIAQRAGYPLDSALRQVLAALRRRGLLTGAAGDQGYRAASPGAPPPAAPAAAEPAPPAPGRLSLDELADRAARRQPLSPGAGGNGQG